MTNYPLSELATIYASDPNGNAATDAVGQGSLAECAHMVAGLKLDIRHSISIHMNRLDLSFGPREIDRILHFLRTGTIDYQLEK